MTQLNTTELSVAPQFYPVTLNQAKRHLQIPTTNTDNDTLIKEKIRMATYVVESELHRKLCYQQWHYYLPAWADSRIDSDGDPSVYFQDGFYMPFGKFQDITSIVYWDTDGDITTWDSSNYSEDYFQDPGIVRLGYNKSWPTTELRLWSPIRIKFDCGWYAGDTWTASTSYTSGDFEDGWVLPTVENGLVYKAGGDGTSDSTEPTWPRSVNGTVVDNDITWTAYETVPFDLKQLVLYTISELYENREDFVVGTIFQKFGNMDGLISSYKLWEF